MTETTERVVSPSLSVVSVVSVLSVAQLSCCLLTLASVLS